MPFRARKPLSAAERKEKHLKRLLGRVQLARMNAYFAGSAGATCFGCSIGLAISIDGGNARHLDYVLVFILAIQLLMWLAHGSDLRREELFGKLHKHVQSLPPEEIDESMDTASFAAGTPTRLEFCRRRWPGILHGSATIAIVGSWCYLSFLVL